MLAVFLLRATGGTRTLNPRFTKAVLYRLSYGGKKGRRRALTLTYLIYSKDGFRRCQAGDVCAARRRGSRFPFMLAECAVARSFSFSWARSARTGGDRAAVDFDVAVDVAVHGEEFTGDGAGGGG